MINSIILAIGFLFGLIVSILIIITLTYFRRVIEHKVNIIEKQIGNISPRPKGFIIEPIEDAEAVRQEIISKNKKAGRSTTIEELQ